LGFGLTAVDCLTSSKYDHLLNDQSNAGSTGGGDEDGLDFALSRSDGQPEHPCLALKKLLGSGTFFYSADFDLTRRLQKRFVVALVVPSNLSRVLDQQPSIAIDSLDAGFLWNSFMVQPLVDFRSRLSPAVKAELDSSRILTSAIRGYCYTVTVPHSSAPLSGGSVGTPSSLTIVSRLSCLRAGTRFNARGMDDDGNAANFVETETVFWSASGCFSYVQVRGSVPIFWEQATGLLPGQQKISITRSPEATQAAFNKHFEMLNRLYTSVHVINLLSAEKSSEAELSARYRLHMRNSSLNPPAKGGASESDVLEFTEYDFHAETRGPNGYEAASAIQHHINRSGDSFGYFVSDERGSEIYRIQQGVYRTNCLDCLDRTNLIQTILSQMALDDLFSQEHEPPSPDFWARHRTLWADNGDTLSKIYAGTGALKSSFTRHGKMSLGGVLSDARKSATRMYINNFADKGRQNTIDLLLGRLVGLSAVHLYDPINDHVQAELKRRADEYTSSKTIHILVGTMNLNGKDRGMREDLRTWLCPEVDESQRNPDIVAVGFQEIVELSPQQIMSTDHSVREAWERAVKATLNDNAVNHGEEEYILLRGSQLVGASLSIFVRAGAVECIKDVEGSIKKVW
jgi:SacI homology domain